MPRKRKSTGSDVTKSSPKQKKFKKAETLHHMWWTTIFKAKNELDDLMNTICREDIKQVCLSSPQTAANGKYYFRVLTEFKSPKGKSQLPKIMTNGKHWTRPLEIRDSDTLAEAEDKARNFVLGDDGEIYEYGDEFEYDDDMDLVCISRDSGDEADEETEEEEQGT